MERSSLRSGLLAVALLAAVPAFAVDVSSAPWKESIEASFVDATGNTRTTTTSGRETFSYAFDAATSLEIKGGGLNARSQGRTTAEQYDAGEEVRHKFDARDYVFEKYRWDKDRFAGILGRQEFSTGLGRDLWKTQHDLLTGEAGPGYLNEERIGDARVSVAMSRGCVKYERDFTTTSKFGQDVEYLQNLADGRDSRFNTMTALTTALSAHFSVKTSFAWRRSNQPPPGFGKNDDLTSFAVIAIF